MRCILGMGLASLAGGLAMGGAMFLTFRTLGFEAGWLLDPATQSAKLIAVWTTLEPRPRILVDPLFMQAGFVGFAAIHAAVYKSISPAWPPGIAARGSRFSALLFVLVYAFWEFFTPFNLFGEPLGLAALELAFWAGVALAEGFAVAAVIEARPLRACG